MSDGYVIVGIHGLANKPGAELLTEWWKMALLEGLERNQDRKSRELAFDLCYWADIRYSEPDKNPEPYVPAKKDEPLPRYNESWLDKVIAVVGNVFDEPIDWAKRYFGVEDLAGAVLRGKMPDLAAYYENESEREAIRQRFAETLGKAKQGGRRIMVIAHSMGSIIAYDVLRQMGREEPGFRVEHLVTIGSPLGLPHVKYKIWQENDRVRTPSVVRKWTNFADRRDLVAADSHLADDYAANGRDVRVRDDRVINTYTSEENGEGDPNYHKSYGYLRTPELSEVVRSFI